MHTRSVANAQTLQPLDAFVHVPDGRGPFGTRRGGCLNSHVMSRSLACSCPSMTSGITAHVVW
jgi:hypothetical protein